MPLRQPRMPLPQPRTPQRPPAILAVRPPVMGQPLLPVMDQQQAARRQAMVRLPV